MRIAAVVLAAGASTRMGRNKMLLDVHGVPMVRRAVMAAVEAEVSPIVVVVGSAAARVRDALADLPCVFAENPEFTGPTSGSLHAGLKALPVAVDASIVMLGDMVRISGTMLRALCDSARSRRAPLDVSRYGNVLAPPLLFQRALWPELLAWHGEGCGKAVVRAHQHEAAIHDWPVECLQDIDTPDDYAALQSAEPAH